MAEIRFLLNGKPRAEIGVSPTTTVLDWLRLNARLTGTKEGCAEGDCGACTIVVGREADGRLRYQAVNSCLMVLPQLDGAAVLTVDGLAAADGTLHPVQQALIDADATQCGFCTPGFVMAMFAFYHGGEVAEDVLIHEALAGNLCRCTGYRSIVEACRRVAAGPSDRFGDAATQTTSALRDLPANTEYSRGEQVYLAPRTLDELHRATAQHPDALLLAGGTDLGLRVSKDRETFPCVISTAAVAELQVVTVDAEALTIGAGITYTQALPYLDQHFPDFGALVRRIGSRQIRNLGTIAGNLATASSISDTVACLIALDASVTLASRSGSRTLPVEYFITGYRTTALTPGEVIAAIRIPLLTSGQRFTAYKLSKRFDQDISTVIAAFRVKLDGERVRDLRAAYGGMAARAARAKNLEALLADRDWAQASEADISAALARDFTPMSDHRGSAAYRLRAAANLVRRLQLESISHVVTRVEAL
jgi:xanthine dehydrogenase small subunit